MHCSSGLPDNLKPACRQPNAAENQAEAVSPGSPCVCVASILQQRLSPYAPSASGARLCSLEALHVPVSMCFTCGAFCLEHSPRATDLQGAASFSSQPASFCQCHHCTEASLPPLPSPPNPPSLTSASGRTWGSEGVVHHPTVQHRSCQP